MHWFDHLSSVVVAGGAVLLGAALLWVRADVATSGTRLFAAQTHHRSFTEQLALDLDNLGVQRPVGAPAIVEASPTRLAFHGLADTLGTPAIIAYEMGPAAADGTRDMRRTVDGDTHGGTHGVTVFDVTLLDGADAPTADPAAAVAVQVRVERLTPFQNASAAALPGATPDPRVGWTTTVRPLALRYTY
ncbi:hypothetical protein [Rubrivirga sp. IMCC45206]|uniref:hypothetical protein n=1 Tax=Rubrivirga sp. IMCC45206 TaxID=3391614 RepID=UPI003990261C